LGENPAKLESLLKELRKFISVPFSVKVSPDWSNNTLDTIGEICRDNEKILINAGNTQFKTPEEVNLNKYDLTTKGGGLSGDSIFNRTLEMVKLYSKFKIPIIATGGISNANQIDLLKKEGANLFGMATSLIMNPYCIPKLNSTFRNV
jgi:dihydroorotate dehydrogenase